MKSGPRRERGKVSKLTWFYLFQLKFKRRVYKMLNLDEKQLKNINSRTNLKKFLDQVLANNVEKVNKMCNKGLDPNFHCQESGGMSQPKYPV